MTKIKPCPFCGSKRSRIEKYLDVWRICIKCKCATRPSNTAREATQAWNDRRPWKDRGK